MIEANQNWLNAIAQQVKQPLYVFEIPDLGIIIASFSAESARVNLGGYGVTAYGAGGYGN
jgi:hypothetical protein